tara:strand:+ start:76 stop:354 length:279 start_codon:yes stop_codon:yes gene_type:complete
MQSTVITETVRRKMSRQCKKCLRGAMTVHIAANGFCGECETERAWKNADRQTILAAQRKNRMDYYEKAQKYIDKKWKKKYGDDDIETVLGYK